MPKTTIVHMVWERDTKGAVRYQEVDSSGKPLKGDLDGALLVSAYFRKLAMRNEMGAEFPKKLTLEIREG